MPSLVTRPSYVKALLWGVAGSGKTTLAATAQDCKAMKPVVFLNFEGGELAVSARGDIQQEPITSIADLEKFFWLLIEGKGDWKGFRSAVIDSGSELQGLSLETHIDQQIAGTAPGKPRAPSTRDDLWLENYGRSTHQLRRLFRMFRDMPMNIIVTALAREQFPVGSKEAVPPISRGPLFTNLLGQSINGMFDFIWHCERKNDKFLVHTQPHGINFAKTRGSRITDPKGFPRKLGHVVENASFKDIHALLIKCESAPKKKKKNKMEMY